MNTVRLGQDARANPAASLRSIPERRRATALQISHAHLLFNTNVHLRHSFGILPSGFIIPLVYGLATFARRW